MEQIDQRVRDERMWGMFCHLSAFAMFIIPFGSIIGPLIIWSMKKDEFPFVNEQGKAALNFHISMIIYMIISAILILIVVGILLLIALGIFQLIMIIIASIKANNGESFQYPLSMTFIH
ncbi:MAG: DUF4870 domain-containing protein [Bacteroidales bacterium]|nr:DUF4870 domain-containing protein [Bacteroidales bacterium]MCF8403318.1 DUF4870 domain-containing protein [Bacteroidales bacterium]